MDGKIDKVDNIAINAICDITHSSPSNSTIVLATFGGLFLIGGILQTIIGAIWFWSSNSEASYNTSNNSSGRNA
jgi:glucokinase